MIILISFLSGVLFLSLSYSHINDYDGLVYDPFIGEPDLYGWDEEEVYYPILDADETISEHSPYSSYDGSPFTISEKVRVMKRIAKSLNISDADWNDPLIKEKTLRRLKRLKIKDTKESLIKSLSKDHSGRAWSLENLEQVITTLTGPSALECLDYRRSGMNCYPNVGCFGYNYTDLDKLCLLPEEDIKVKFKLYSKSDRIIGQMIDERWHDKFEYASNVAIYFHGFMGSGKDKNAIRVKDAILNDTSEYNQVILVDYEWAVRGLSYQRALSNTDVIGRQVGHMLHVLHKNRGLKINKDVYLIGYSIGVIVSHFTAKYIKARVRRPARITALDPAAPLLEYCEGCPISKRDAKFVDVIHTSGGYSKHMIKASYLWGYLGISEAVGHVDFYPNGGGYQIECKRRYAWKKIADPSCSHAKSVDYFVLSIKYCEYRSIPCTRVHVYAEGMKSCKEPINGEGNKMGYHANKFNGTGSHYVRLDGLFC